MKNLISLVVGIACLAPVGVANEVDDVYLSTFEQVRDRAFGSSAASRLISETNRIDAAKSFCEWLRSGETKETYWSEIVIPTIAKIHWEERAHSDLVEKVFRQEQAVMITVAPSYYCPEQTESYRSGKIQRRP